MAAAGAAVDRRTSHAPDAALTTEDFLKAIFAASLAAPNVIALIDPLRVECVALFDETDIGHVPVGEADFTVDAIPDESFTGTVNRVEPDASVIGVVVDYASLALELARNCGGVDQIFFTRITKCSARTPLRCATAHTVRNFRTTLSDLQGTRRRYV